MHEQIRQVIAGSDLFGGLRPVLIDEIAAMASRRKLHAGEILFQQGDPADALWGVLSGRVEIDVGNEEGKELVLDVFSVGDVFGEVGVLDFGPRRVQARAAVESELFRVERNHLLNCLQQSPELCFRVFTFLCSHLRDTTENLEDTVLHKLDRRLAKRLVQLASSDGEIHQELSVSQSELAGLLGVNREAVNRHLRRFEIEGLVTLGRGRLSICDLESLQDLAGRDLREQRDAWARPTFDALKLADFQLRTTQAHVAPERGRRNAGLLAVDAAEYSHALMTDAAGTLKRIQAGLAAVEKAIAQYQGHTVWHTGDRVLAEFPDAKRALQAALAIQDSVAPARGERNGRGGSLFRIGVHHGEVRVEEQRYLGDAVNTVIRLTELSSAGGITISGALREVLDNPEQLDLQFLGEHELKNVPGTVPVYSARSIPMFRMLALRAETLVSRRYRPVALGIFVAFMATAIWFTGDWLGRQRSPLSVSEHSIAVLPFSFSGKPELVYLSGGIARDIRMLLARVPGVQVSGGESSEYFEGGNYSTEEIGRALSVAWLLKGDLVIQENGASVDARLLDTTGGRVVYQARISRSREALVDLGPDIVRQVIEAMGWGSSGGTELAQITPLTRSPVAHSLYLEAIGYINLVRLHEAKKAIPLLERAVESDPEFAEAHALLADRYRAMTALFEDHEVEYAHYAELGQQSLRQAVAISPDSPEVLAVAAKFRLMQEDADGAMSLAKRSLRFDPNNTAALLVNKSVQWRMQEDWAAALATSEQLIELEPLASSVMQSHMLMLFRANRNAEALAIGERMMSFYPERSAPHVYATVALIKLRLQDRLGAVESSRKGMHYGVPVDLWTGLEHDWNSLDELFPAKAISGLVYVEKYNEVRDHLKQHYDAVGSDSPGAKSLDYLVSMGDLETLAGNFQLAADYFDRAERLLPDDKGLVAHALWFNMVAGSRQSHFSLSMLQAYRKTGQAKKAEEVAKQIQYRMAHYLTKAASISDAPELQSLYEQAQFHAIEKRNKKAIELLRIWVDRSGLIFTYIKWDPFFENLRGNPEFEAIVAEVEAELAAIRAQFHAREAKSVIVERG